MATVRKITFVNDYIYHVFNRGIERRSIFTNKREFERAQELIKFYKHKETPIRFSRFIKLAEDVRNNIPKTLYKSERLVDILAYCLMPNHFHFMLKQNTDRGISTFISNFANAYTKYFNTKNQRSGPLLEGVFKAVLVESEEQLIHLSRYIHLNPIASSIIGADKLDYYAWSSYPEYLSLSNNEICQKSKILEMFKSVEEYQKFVNDQIEYTKKLEAIKHLTLE